MLIRKILKKIGILPKQARRYSQLYTIIDKIQPKKIMEIGTWNGKRAISMIEEAKKYHNKEEIHYYGFDLFEDLSNEEYERELSKKPPSKQIVNDAISHSGANIHLYQGNTMEVLPAVASELPKMDFVYIDGGHSLTTIESDWLNTIKVMDKNTVVVFDDYWVNREDGGCKPIVDKIDRTIFDVEILPITDKFNNSDFGKLVIRFAKVSFKK
ncbi:class I SAM-dependent methyltransferase [Patescibacteria group bacterium]|nr:class I SAM-dependent methyltransferase [Patescibacteria group bacterium]